MLQQITPDNLQQMLTRFSTGELENLVDKFPYFQQAHLLLAKKYQQENNPRFDQQLQLAALYTSDRALLYNLFHQKYDAAIPSVSPVEIQREEKVELIAPAIEIKTEKIQLGDETEIVETQIEEPVAITEQEKEEPPFLKTEPHSFDEWLQAFSKIVPAVEREVENTEETGDSGDEELNRTIMSNMPLDYLNKKVDEETHYSKALDQFIEEEIEKHKHTPVKPLAENELDPELITETMAKVYEMQKKYARAIKAYELLSLKFPEKSGYFAARISYIKNIL